MKKVSCRPYRSREEIDDEAAETLGLSPPPLPFRKGFLPSLRRFISPCSNKMMIPARISSGAHVCVRRVNWYVYMRIFAQPLRGLLLTFHSTRRLSIWRASFLFICAPSEREETPMERAAQMRYSSFSLAQFCMEMRENGILNFRSNLIDKVVVLCMA